MQKKVVLLLCWLAAMGIAWTQQTTINGRPYPLPSRETRLSQEAQDQNITAARLLELAEDKNPNVRLVAVRAIGIRGDENALPVLAKVQEAAAAFPEVRSRLDAAVRVATLLIRNREQPADEQVRQLQPLLSSPDWATQAEAILAISTIPSTFAADMLAQYLQSHRPGEYGYIRALFALADRKDPRVLSYIETYVTTPRGVGEGIGGVGTDAITHDDLFRIERLYWEIRLHGASLEDSVAVFVEKYTAKTRTPSYGLETVMAQIGPPVIPYMARILHDQKAPRNLRQIAARVLMQLPYPDAASALVSVAEDDTEEQDFRRLMEGLLASQGHPRAVTATLQTLSRRDEQGNISNALWRIERLARAGVDRHQLEDAVLPYLRPEVELGQGIAVQAIREVGSKRAIQPLLDLGVDALAKLEKQTGTEANRTNTLLRNIVTSLGFIGRYDPGKVLPFLIDRLYAQDPLLRIVAAQALARTGSPEVIPVLVDQLKKETDPTAIWHEVSAICVLDDKQALEALGALKREGKNERLLELVDEALYRLRQEGQTEK